MLLTQERLPRQGWRSVDEAWLVDLLGEVSRVTDAGTGLVRCALPRADLSLTHLAGQLTDSHRHLNIVINTSFTISPRHTHAEGWQISFTLLKDTVSLLHRRGTAHL